MKIGNFEFLIRPLTIVQRRKLRAQNGFDLQATANQISKAKDSQDPNAAILSGPVVEDVLETVFPDQITDIEEIGLVGQIELFAAILRASLYGGEEEKNSLRSTAGAPVDPRSAPTHATLAENQPASLAAGTK